MKRLTTDHPDGNFEMAMNFVYGKDGAAYIRSDGERDDVPLHEWAKAQCLAHGCGEFPGETMEEIDEEICSCGFDFPGCPIHLAYTFACQAVHLRTRLKRYEDTGLEPEDIDALQKREQGLAELLVNISCGCAVSYSHLEELAQAEKDGRLVVLPPNAPLTLEQLREMDGEPVWIERTDGADRWALIRYCNSGGIGTYGCGFLVFEDHGKTWRAYRRKPEEV